MGHRTTHPVARTVASQVARLLTPAVALESDVEPTGNSSHGNKLRTSSGTIDSCPWVGDSVASWVADGVASEGGATPRFALAHDPAPDGAGPRRGSLPLRFRQPQPCLASDAAESRHSAAVASPSWRGPRPDSIHAADQSPTEPRPRRAPLLAACRRPNGARLCSARAL